MLGQDSIWQTGPKWLVEDRSKWPITPRVGKEKDYSVDQINEAFKKKSSTPPSSQSLCFSVDTIAPCDVESAINNCDTLKKLIRTVALVMRWRLKHLRIASTASSTAQGRDHSVYYSSEITSSEYIDAWNYIIYSVQKTKMKIQNLQRLVPVTIPVKLSNYAVTLEHIVIGGRVKNFPASFSVNKNIPIISYRPLGVLIVRHYHNRYHKEVDTTVVHVRSDVWLVEARRIASQIDNKCRICLERRKKLAGQVMGDLPECRSNTIMPAWSSVTMDLFGPMIIRDDCVKKGPRVTKKVWGVIYTCTRTRGIYLDVAVDYSTKSILHTVRRLLGHKGNVREIISDAGSQLRAADKEMQSWRYGWEKNELVKFGSDIGLDWKFIMPNSQHQNGASEALIKLVKGIKQSLMKSLGNVYLSLDEMNTLLVEVANLVNSRPIGLKPNSNTDPEFLSPNSLFLGRCSDRISQGPFQSKDTYMFEGDRIAENQERFLLVQMITNQFWKTWLKLYFPTLLIRQKWHHEKRNFQIGDVCLLKDSVEFRGDWRLAKVSAVFPDEHGIVRNVEVTVVPKQDGSLPYKPVKANHLKRHVSNLILLVESEDTVPCEVVKS